MSAVLTPMESFYNRQSYSIWLFKMECCKNCKQILGRKNVSHTQDGYTHVILNTKSAVVKTD